MASSYDMTNDLLDNGQRTRNPCVRCMTGFMMGEIRYGSQVGCCFPDPERSVEGVWDHLKFTNAKGDEFQTMKCFRCVLVGQDCCAIPPEFKSEMLRVNRLLDIIEPGFWANAELFGEKDAAGNPVCTMSMEDLNRYQEAKFKLREVAGRLSKTLGRKPWIPHKDHLNLHTGVLGANEDARSGCRPGGRERSTASVAATKEAKARKHMQDVDSKMAEMAEQGTPSKKQRMITFDTNKANEGRIKELKDKIEADKAALVPLVEQHAASKGKTKAALKKRMNGFEKSIKEHEAEIETLK